MATCARVTARGAQHLPLLSSPPWTPSHSGFSPILLLFFPFPSPSSLLSSLHQRPPSPPPFVTAASSFPSVSDRCPDHHLNALVDSFLSDDRVHSSPALFFYRVHRAPCHGVPSSLCPSSAASTTSVAASRRCQHHPTEHHRRCFFPPPPRLSLHPLLHGRCHLPLLPFPFRLHWPPSSLLVLYCCRRHNPPPLPCLACLLSSPTTLFEPSVDPPPFPYRVVHRRCCHRLPLHPCQCHDKSPLPFHFGPVGEDLGKKMN